VGGIASGILSIGAEHISEQGDLNLVNPRYIPKEFFSQMTKGVVSQDDILLVKDGATTGRVALIASGEERGLAVNEHVFILRPDKVAVDPSYVFYALRSPLGQSAISDAFHGAAQGGITQQFAKSVWIPFPSTMKEQKQTASKIKERMGEAQSLRQICERQSSAAAALARNLVNEMVREAGEPSGHLGDILRSPPKSGWAHAYGNETKGIPFLTLTAVLNFRYDGTQVKYTDYPMEDVSDYWAKSGDIFMSRSNTPELVGHAAVYDGTPANVVFPDLLIRLHLIRARRIFDSCTTG
jgi:type I restriction enzyme S subunit